MLQMQEKASNRGALSEQEKVDMEVFKNAFIPRTLEEVKDPERDLHDDNREVQLMPSFPLNKQPLYQVVTGLKKDLSGAQILPEVLQEDALSQNSRETEETTSSSSDSEDEEQPRITRPIQKEESGLSKQVQGVGCLSEQLQEWKKKVKEEKREKRKMKMPKHLKKKKERSSKEKQRKNAARRGWYTHQAWVNKEHPALPQ